MMTVYAIGNNIAPLVKSHPFTIIEKELYIVVVFTKMDDVTLMRRIVQKEEDALGALYDRYGRLVFSVAYGVVQNRETAEEVTLDIFTRAWDKANRYDQKRAKVSTWLTRMARNLAIDRLRREKVRPSHHSVHWSEVTAEPVSTDDLPETAVFLNVQQHRVRTAVNSLPTNQQESLSLAYFQGYSHSQIARSLNQPLGTVKGRIRAGMQTLRILLAEER